MTSERCPSKARAFVKIDGSHLGPAGLVPSFIHPWPDHQLLAYGSSVCLMLINRANNIFEIDWRWCRARQPWPWQLALQPSFDSLSVTPRTLLCCYSAVTTALYPPFFSFYIIIWFLRKHLIFLFCFFWSRLQSIWWWRFTGTGKHCPFNKVDSRVWRMPCMMPCQIQASISFDLRIDHFIQCESLR